MFHTWHPQTFWLPEPTPGWALYSETHIVSPEHLRGGQWWNSISNPVRQADPPAAPAQTIRHLLCRHRGACLLIHIWPCCVQHSKVIALIHQHRPYHIDTAYYARYISFTIFRPICLSPYRQDHSEPLSLDEARATETTTYGSYLAHVGLAPNHQLWNQVIQFWSSCREDVSAWCDSWRQDRWPPCAYQMFLVGLEWPLHVFRGLCPWIGRQGLSCELQAKEVALSVAKDHWELWEVSVEFHRLGFPVLEAAPYEFGHDHSDCMWPMLWCNLEPQE